MSTKVTWISKLKAQLKFKFWLSTKMLFNRELLFDGSAPLSFFGLVLGVAALVASMSVMRGFEASLKVAMIDVTSDIQIVKKGRLIESWDEFASQVKKIDPQIQDLTRFAYTEAVAASRGKVSGVLLQGFEFDQAQKVLNLKARIQQGDLNQGLGYVAIGAGMSRKYNLKINDDIYVAVSLSTPFQDSSFKRQGRSFKVSAIMDFGKNDWNERLILTRLADFQDLTQIGDRYTGAFVKIRDSNAAQLLSYKISDQLGPKFAVMNWYEVNRNLFEAVKLESVVIFFVVFLIVIIAAFNISSTLYVLIRQRYKEIAVLKALGARETFVQGLFVMQGAIVATNGCFFGFIVGFLLSRGFMFLQSNFPLISGSVYKIDRIDVSLSFTDFVLIYLATLIACLLATYPPARKGSRLQVVEGLKQE